MRRLIRDNSPLLNTLDNRERQIVNLIDAGVMHEKIGEQLEMKKDALTSALQAIYKKLHIHETSSPASHGKRYTEYCEAWDKLKLAR
jgi:DNA-binding NarL/FixJ family response regulator